MSAIGERSFNENYERAMAAADETPRMKRFRGEVPFPSDVMELKKWVSRDIFERFFKSLGLKRGKMPADFSGTFIVDGHKFVVYPQGYAPTSEGNIPKTHTRWRHGSMKSGGIVKAAAHRVYIEFRGRLVPLGRLHQVAVK